MTGVRQLRFWLTAPKTHFDYWYEHIADMVGACIATVTAFLVVNVGRLGLQAYALWFWITPGIVGGIGVAMWQRYYRHRFANVR